MINIAIDFGNSSIKVGLFEGSKLLQKFVLKNAVGLGLIISKPHQHIIVASVKENSENILQQSAAAGKKIVLSAETPLPVQIKYDTPQSLGVDRIAAVCGAFQLFPNQDCLIIDMGTCINYELLDQSGNYLGGIISPGMNMRFQAMHTFTARLPLTQSAVWPQLVGKSTTACLQSGTMNGIMEEMKGVVEKLKVEYPALRVIICGGDASLFENQWKPSIFAAPELVLVGLNRILSHNVEI